MHTLRWIIVAGNQFFTLLMVGIMVFVYKVMGNQFLKRTYTIVDIGFYTLNTFTNLLIVAPGTDNVTGR